MMRTYLAIIATGFLAGTCSFSAVAITVRWILTGSVLP